VFFSELREVDPMAFRGLRPMFTQSSSQRFGGGVEAVPKKEVNYEPRNNIGHPVDTRTAWRSADMGLQQQLGLRSGWSRGASTRHRDRSFAPGANINVSWPNRPKRKKIT